MLKNHRVFCTFRPELLQMQGFHRAETYKENIRQTDPLCKQMCCKWGLHTCNDLLWGTVRAVAGLILGQHCNMVGLTALHVVYYAVTLFCVIAADVTCAAHHGGVELNSVTG